MSNRAMSKRMYSIFSVLRRRVERAGSQKAAAAALGISAQYLCDIIKGRREISAELSRRLGYKRIVVYVPLERRSR